MGVPLVARTTRQVGLTAAGEALLEGLGPALANVELAIEKARLVAGTIGGRLRINAPRAVSPLLYRHLIMPFLVENPQLECELVSSDSFDAILAEGFDAGIRLGEMLDDEMVAVPLTTPFSFGVFASPDYLDRKGRPERPADVLDHQCIRFLGSDGTVLPWGFVEDGHETTVAVTGPILVNDASSNIAAASAGAGLAYGATPVAAAAIAEGSLEPVLQPYYRKTSGLYLYFPGRQQSLPRLRALVEFVRRIGRYNAADMPPSTKIAAPVR